MTTHLYMRLKIKRQLEEKELVGAKVKTVPVGLLGADKAPIALTVTGPNFDDVMLFAQKAAAELKSSWSIGSKINFRSW